jgi:hypothetical protein
MPEIQRQEWSSELRDHERRIAELSQLLATIQRQSLPRIHHEVIFLTAQMMKHRISMALLASRLGEAMPLQQ